MLELFQKFEENKIAELASKIRPIKNSTLIKDFGTFPRVINSKVYNEEDFQNYFICNWLEYGDRKDIRVCEKFKDPTFILESRKEFTESLYRTILMEFDNNKLINLKLVDFIWLKTLSVLENKPFKNYYEQYLIDSKNQKEFKKIDFNDYYLGLLMDVRIMFELFYENLDAGGFSGSYNIGQEVEEFIQHKIIQHNEITIPNLKYSENEWRTYLNTEYIKDEKYWGKDNDK